MIAAYFGPQSRGKRLGLSLAGERVSRYDTHVASQHEIEVVAVSPSNS